MLTLLILFLHLHGLTLLQTLCGVVSGASALTNFMKKNQNNQAVGAISKIVHALALNFSAVKIEPPTFNE